jgi:hypothetical protein
VIGDREHRGVRMPDGPYAPYGGKNWTCSGELSRRRSKHTNSTLMAGAGNRQ